jgi:hypothetical protein
VEDILGGPSLEAHCRVALGGVALKVESLLDTGAGCEILIHHDLKPFVKARLKPKILRISKPVPVSGHTNQQTDVIEKLFQANLVINGRRIQSWFLFCNTGRHDLIVGRKWFERTGVLVDCRGKRLIWLDDRDYDGRRDIAVPRSELVPPVVDPAHQHDADLRDQALRREIEVGKVKLLHRKEDVKPATQTAMKQASSPHLNRKRESLPAPASQVCRTPSSHDANQRQALRRMDVELSKHEPEQVRLEIKTKKPVSPSYAGVDIAIVEASGFLRNARRHDITIGSTSLYEINRLIEDREKERDGLKMDDDDLRQLIAEKLPFSEYSHVFSKAASDELPPYREGVDHDIVLTGDLSELGTSPLYSMSLEHLKMLKEYLHDHLQKSFIEHSDAPYASPVLFAKKPGGGWRFCVDYRKLNAITKKDKYPLPLIEETLARLARARIFTKLDVRQAFYRIRMKDSVKDLTTFRTRYGTYRYKVLPFGLCNGPASFQRYINNTLFDYLDDFCTAYIDDILIYSEDPLEHEVHVKKVLQRLSDAGLQADIKKSEFFVTETKFLGYIISTGGVRMDPQKVAAIKDWKPPKTLKGVQSFLGFCNFYRQFLKDYGRVVRPLTKLTGKGAWKPLGPTELEAFERAKTLVLTGGLLVHYSAFKPTRVETDASDGVTAGVLNQQQEDGCWRPVAYYSKTMSPEEMRYEIHDKEMLAVMRGLSEWKGCLVGLQTTPFTIITDHKALEHFTTKRLLNPRQGRWADELANYDFRITYRPGSANIIADALTRKQDELNTQKAKDEAARTKALVDPSLVVASVEAIPDKIVPYQLVDAILEANRSEPSLEEFRIAARAEKGGWKLENSLLTRFDRLMVPDTKYLRTHLIKEIHACRVTAHPGQKKTRQLVTEQYYWPGLPSDCDTYVNNCKDCRWNHLPRDKTPGLLKPLPIGERCWQHVSFDFKSFPKDKQGYNNVFVVVDRLGKRAFSLPCKKEVSAVIAAKLYYEHIWRIYGTPETATSDRGPQFISAFTNELCKLTGVKQKLSTAYHPQTDGNTEILNQYLDQRLRPFINHFQDDWADLLPAMDFAQATMTHESTGLSPFELEFGYKPRRHFDWKERTTASSTPREQLTREQAQQFARRAHDAVAWARANLFRAQQRQQQQANKKRREPDFTVGNYVYVTRKGWTTDRPSEKLDRQLAGSYKIIGMKGHSYVLELPENMKMSNVFHADRLRKDPRNPLPGQEQPPEDPMEVNGFPEWEVDKILASRIYRDKLQYMADWVGYDPDDQFYDASSFINSPHKVQEYHKAYPDEPGPPTRLDVWLKAYQNEETLEPTDEDNLAVKKGVKRRQRRKA